MEKVGQLAVVPASFGWSDLGSWDAAFELAERDDQDNAVDPGTVVVDSRGNLVRDLTTTGRPRVIALVGVEGLCVVQTDDALLVMRREQAQDVREVVRQLEAQGRDDLL
jgi:mannose-1-phosphate guanylyltransferase